ncbi:KRTAP20-4 isoform 1 [Pan troglodytes]|uniref:Putative keratin-associated protein 20-4 n=3 Tax=Homininae TaxID=207598 RepID=KR204_HUMAN|nr:putative keratin-associated protein 20-4 [Homo sapiens]XP_024208118.1 putative keratin-associated protein 20-4 [Pan troglodytes]XP_024782739.1 putative keratin-associated protein 20-4 [Pan paniscus]Q3LI62.1 RecName: Full=Putative keratin-associated protein 20-4 [Homo sapiens]PNI61592.1 KRTAP20-4 isoform 1 [Pan troglodytes]BAE46371.1 keratin associated protein [Homo sapiens]|eukprot:NP_001337906.1 putative keratin-associated protein 20-4 [Homo sapiens]
MSYYSHLSGGLGCGLAVAVTMGRTVAVAEYGRCRHGCHSSYSAR